MQDNTTRRDEGFTLIELLVVILIIAILAAVGIVALLSATSAGKKSAATTTLRNAITVVKSIQAEHGGELNGITIADLNAAEPDMNFKALPLFGGSAGLGPTEVTNWVGVLYDTTGQTFWILTRTDAKCYGAAISSSQKTKRYEGDVQSNGYCNGMGLTQVP